MSEPAKKKKEKKKISLGICCKAGKKDVCKWILIFLFLLQVTVPGEVVDVACGIDHMVILVKSFI